ncbi:putative cysteine desulfurase [Pseudoalteromonas holothuriae]|uniref:Cysteine desulfurase n=1 Tax=Pseudoalteromonas holothuriae TaxID=2963714 RepID=A0A9W4R016_9GAMM|nr:MULTISPECIES: SufS family cysteine desulfurase [unclassified Pseudoalteromonas]CAH9060487.1 putative cysteine desulfurase [Pseudoalteromonas sp. CIP111951]CAH9060663.1 putative cysteine desulfurase [Pseudoalteromonas sp. CIP111854]
MSDIAQLRNDFVTLNQSIEGNPLVYLDSGATSQKPQVVINEINHFYSKNNANVHRGLHTLSERVTSQYEGVREKLAQFLGVFATELVWTSGATHSINLVASGLTNQLRYDDVILITALEHHANIVPWQQLAQRTGAKLKVIPVNDQGIICTNNVLAQIQKWQPKIFACTHASNTLGNILDVQVFIAQAKKIGATTIIDGAQAFLHLRPNLRQLDCDFYVLSAHKALGPTGLGILFGKYEQLNALPVYQTGGEMIETVTFDQTTFRQAPAKFEPGTPNISAVLGFGAAIDYLSNINFSAMHKYEQSLFKYLLEHLSAIKGVKLYGDLDNNIGTISFTFKSEHHYDLAMLLNSYGVAVRSGHHCTQPLMQALNLNGTIRVSLAFYNNHTDIDRFISALNNCIQLIEG